MLQDCPLKGTFQWHRASIMALTSHLFLWLTLVIMAAVSCAPKILAAISDLWKLV